MSDVEALRDHAGRILFSDQTCRDLHAQDFLAFGEQLKGYDRQIGSLILGETVEGYENAVLTIVSDVLPEGKEGNVEFVQAEPDDETDVPGTINLWARDSNYNEHIVRVTKQAVPKLDGHASERAATELQAGFTIARYVVPYHLNMRLLELMQHSTNRELDAFFTSRVQHVEVDERDFFGLDPEVVIEGGSEAVHDLLGSRAAKLDAVTRGIRILQAGGQLYPQE